MTFGNSVLIKCLLTINDYIVEERLDLSKYPKILEKNQYPEEMVTDVKNAIINIKESCRDIEIYHKPKRLDPDKELQLSVEDAIEAIDKYIESGGFQEIKLNKKPATTHDDLGRIDDDYEGLQGGA